MPANPILLDQTPAGGLLLNVTDAPGGLVGLTLLSQDGPPADIEVSYDGVSWSPVTLPYTVEVGSYLRLTRTDPVAMLTTINATFPDSPTP